MLIQINDFVIDASLSESHKFESEVTDYPVESGASVTDNVRPRPIQVTIEGLVSNTPIGRVADIRSASMSIAADFLPSDEAIAKLLKIRDDRLPVPIATSLRRFENMVMTSLDVPRDAETGHALKFTAEFQQVTFVQNVRTTVRVAAPNHAGVQKKTQPPVVVVKRSPLEPLGLTDDKGKALQWDNQRARFAHEDGTPASRDEISRAKARRDAAEAQNGTIGQPSTREVYDTPTDRWKNADGTPLTQTQAQSLDKSGAWWDGNRWQGPNASNAPGDLDKVKTSSIPAQPTGSHNIADLFTPGGD